MKFINKLERKFGRYAIHNLTLYIVICYVVGYMLYLVSPSLLFMLNLNVSAILQGQIWRLVTWIVSPPGTGNVLLFAISILFFYYPLGNALEKTLGAFRYNLYIFSGMLFTVIGAFILHFITGGVVDFLGINIFSTYYISLSVFLAFAALYPDMQLMLWFVIPIKMKWMALVYIAIIVYNMINYLRYGAWFMIVPIIASLLNFVIFFLYTRDFRRIDPREIRRRQQFRKAMEPQSRASASGGTVTKHKCAICGRTEKDDPSLEFRFCSKCNGNYEYCQDHLFTHTHVK